MRAWPLALLLLLGCGEEDNYLDGSVGVSLSFDRVSARMIGDDLELRYLRDVAGGQEETAELIVLDVRPVLSADLDLPLNPDNAVIGRTVTDGSTFPELEGGSLVIESGGAVGETLDGRFGVRFVTGTTLSGGFRTRLEEVTVQ